MRRDLIVLSLRSGVPFTDLIDGPWTGPDVSTLEYLINRRDERREEARGHAR